MAKKKMVPEFEGVVAKEAVLKKEYMPAPRPNASNIGSSKRTTTRKGNVRWFSSVGAFLLQKR